MKSLFEFYWKISRKLLQKELKSSAGKVNLIGGIIATCLAAAILIEDILTKVLNFILAIFERPLLPVVNSLLILVAFMVIPAYFFLSLKNIKE